jgi:hypothetical protein
MDDAMSNTAPALRWSLPGMVRIAYSTMADGDQRDPANRARWTTGLGIGKPVVVPAQVHGSTVVRLPAEGDQLATADGVMSLDAQDAIGVFGADCPGVCLTSEDALAVAHCGWRGTASGIISTLVAAFQSMTTQPPSRWRAFIGPGISGSRYEVDGPVLAARAWPPQAIGASRPGHAQLDLRVAIAHDLRSAGVLAIDSTPICTAGDERLWSYRRRGAGLVQLLVAWREGKPAVGTPP